jgi:hypothetical protein
MLTALSIFGGSVVVLALLIIVYSLEDSKGERVFLRSFREALDSGLLWMMRKMRSLVTFFTHSFMRLLLHYGLHTILSRILNALRDMEKKVEELVRKNKRVAKAIQAAKSSRSHLHQVREHKEEVALSEEDKERLRSKNI